MQNFKLSVLSEFNGREGIQINFQTWFLGCGLEPYCSSPWPPHLKSDIASLSGNLGRVKWGLSPPHTWQQLNATHIPSSVTPGTVSMTATGKPFQTGLGGREWESFLQQSSLSPPWTRHSEKRGTGVKLIEQPGKDWGPSSTMQPENLLLCLVRVAVAQAHVMGWMECPVSLGSASKSMMARRHLALLPSMGILTMDRFLAIPRVKGSRNMYLPWLKQHKGNLVFTSQIRNT